MHDGVDTARLAGGHDRPAGGGLGGRRRDLEAADPPRQPQAAGGSQFGDAGGLEAQLDQARGGDERSGFRLRGSAGRLGGQLADGGVTVPPDAGQHLVGGAVEVHA